VKIILYGLTGHGNASGVSYSDINPLRYPTAIVRAHYYIICLLSGESEIITDLELRPWKYELAII